MNRTSTVVAAIAAVLVAAPLSITAQSPDRAGARLGSRTAKPDVSAALQKGGGKSGGGKSGSSSGSGKSSGGSVKSGSSSKSGTVNGRSAKTRNSYVIKSRPVWKSRQVIVVNRRYYGGYYPWGYSGIGFGAYYGGYYDPWWYDGYDEDYGAGYDGSLRLKVTPREAAVYVDGYLAGNVDDFDGVLQRLHLDSGPHRIEVRLDGYEPLDFEVKITPDDTVTYSADLKKLP